MTDRTEQLFTAVVASLELAAVALGARLGWYADLDAAGPSTAAELAGRTGTDARYAREWLEQQAVSGYLDVDDVAAAPDRRRYGVSPDNRGLLVDPLDEGHLVPMARLTSALTRRVPELAEVYRGRRTLGWDDFGADAREGQAAGNRPWFLGSMAGQLATVPGVDAVLSAGGRVADIGCGFGWSAIGIARAWPTAVVDAFDVDPPSLEAARRNVAEAGLTGRVTVRADDVTTLPAGGYDLVTAFECVHDLPDPVAVLAAMGGLAAPAGTVLVVDEKVADRFTAPGDDVERLMYGFSVLCCLPDGRAGGPSAATGTVMRPDTLRGYAREAGFADVEVLPVEHDVFRFYRLHR